MACHRPDMATAALAFVTAFFTCSIGEATAALTEPNTAKTNSPLSYKDFSKYLTIIEGDRGRGSGFIAIFREKAFLFTNTHVLSGNSKMAAKLLNGQNLALRALFVSDACDVSILQQDTTEEGIGILQEVERNVSIGDDVVVVGNSLGAGVITEITGKVLGIGPDRIEVDAKFVEGNSGSPIVHVKTGKVIGIATYYEVREMSIAGKDSKFNNVVRRFAYRIDNIKAWHNISWSAFATESSTLNKIDTKTTDLFNLFIDIAQNGGVANWSQHLRPDNCLNQAARNWQKAIARYGKPDRVYRDWYTGEEKTVQLPQTKQLIIERERFLSSVMGLINGDAAVRQPDKFTGIHKGLIEDQKRYREFLNDYFNSLRNQLGNDPNF